MSDAISSPPTLVVFGWTALGLPATAEQAVAGTSESVGVRCLVIVILLAAGGTARQGTVRAGGARKSRRVGVIGQSVARDGSGRAM